LRLLPACVPRPLLVLHHRRFGNLQYRSECPVEPFHRGVPLRLGNRKFCPHALMIPPFFQFIGLALPPAEVLPVKQPLREYLVAVPLVSTVAVVAKEGQPVHTI